MQPSYFFGSKRGRRIFYIEEMLRLLKDHKEKKEDNSRKIWMVLSFLIWYDKFFVTYSK